jgi:hypothetical protein
VGPAWLVAGPGLRDILAVAAQGEPVAVPIVAVPPVAGRRVVAGQVAGASIPPAVLVIVVAAAAAPTSPAAVFPTRPEMVVQSAGDQRNSQQVPAHLHCLLLRLLLIWVERGKLRLHRVLRLQSVILALQIDQVVVPKSVVSYQESDQRTQSYGSSNSEPESVREAFRRASSSSLSLIAFARSASSIPRACSAARVRLLSSIARRNSSSVAPFARRAVFSSPRGTAGVGSSSPSSGGWPSMRSRMFARERRS